MKKKMCNQNKMGVLNEKRCNRNFNLYIIYIKWHLICIL
jgi:hypothetical protein